MSLYVKLMSLSVLLSGCSEIVTIQEYSPQVIGLVYDKSTDKPIPDVTVKLGPVIKNNLKNQYLLDISKADGSFLIKQHDYAIKIERSQLNKPKGDDPRIFFFHKNYQTSYKTYSDFFLLDRQISNVKDKHFNMEKRTLNMKKVYLMPKTQNNQ